MHWYGEHDTRPARPGRSTQTVDNTLKDSGGAMRLKSVAAFKPGVHSWSRRLETTRSIVICQPRLSEKA